MYIERLKNEYENIKNIIKYMEKDKNNNIEEIYNLKRELIKLDSRIKIEELYEKYTSKKPMNYHYVDKNGSEIDCMLNYGEDNYENAYKQSRNRLYADEAWDLLMFDREKQLKKEETIKKETTIKPIAVLKKEIVIKEEKKDKKINIHELINLKNNSNIKDILKLIGFYGISNLWKGFEQELSDGSISKEEFNSFSGYLKANITENSVFYQRLFNEDYKKIEAKYANKKEQSNILPPLPSIPVKRKKAKKSLIEKFKMLNRNKKIALCVAGTIALIGIGATAYHLIPHVLNNQTKNVTNTEKTEMMADYENDLIDENVDETQDNIELKNDNTKDFKTIKQGDIVYKSAADSIANKNGLKASKYFNDTVVAVFDISSKKAIIITPENINSLKKLLDDPNTPKAFGKSYTNENVDGWKTGSGYKTILDESSNKVGGKNL